MEIRETAMGQNLIKATCVSRIETRPQYQVRPHLHVRGVVVDV